MQFIVFAAFAIVLSMPLAGPPWKALSSPVHMWLAVAGQILLPLLVALITTMRVIRKLEQNPAWLPAAQQRMSRGNTQIRTTLFVTLCLTMYLTDWSAMVHGWSIISPIFGLADLIMLIPFFAGILITWIVLYPADRAIRQVSLEMRLWAAAPVRPIWSCQAYLNFMLRHNVLIIAVPMVPIVAANDFINAYGQQIRTITGLAWAADAVLVMIAGLVFLFAPAMLRYIWHTQSLPPGPLRARLEAICRHIGLTYREILIWQSDGMVINAAVMGIARPIRYILLSDGLLEMMEDRKIEAVFGHEAGHIKHRHIHFFLLFAILSMLIVGGIMQLVLWYYPDLLRGRSAIQDYLQVAAMVLVILVWAMGFGFVSKRFEWQADLFGARSVTPPANECNQPCPYHGTALPGNTESDPLSATMPKSTLCATGATVFAETLHEIAALNGIPINARSWRHSSIANRIQQLKAYPHNPAMLRKLECGVIAIKTVLIVGTAIGLAIALYLYWPVR